MVYRRYRRPGWLASGAASAGRGALRYAGGRLGYGLAKRLHGALKKLWRRRKGRSGVGRRLSRRRNRKFLTSMNMTPNRVCTLVYRGNLVKNGPSNSNMADLIYLSLNNARDPGRYLTDTTNVGAIWGKCATGFAHMSTLYHDCRTLSSVAYITVRASKVFNLQATSSGTSTYGAGINAVPMKVGVLKSELFSAFNEFSSWDDAALRDDPIKTFNYKFSEPLNSCHFVVRFNPKRFWAHRSDETLYQTYHKTSNPSALCNAIVWMQVADKASTPTIIAWDISWVIKYRVLFSQFAQIESDMGETTIPS